MVVVGGGPLMPIALERMVSGSVSVLDADALEALGVEGRISGPGPKGLLQIVRGGVVSKDGLCALARAPTRVKPLAAAEAR